MNAPASPAIVDEGAVCAFVEALHQQARSAFGTIHEPGLLQLMRIHPEAEGDAGVSRFPIGDVDGMAAQAVADALEGYNVYAEGRLVRPGLARGARGTAADTIGVFALVADRDADKGRAGVASVIEPSMVVETSPGNTHDWFFLDRAVSPAVATRLGQGLRTGTGADSDTGNFVQPYRVAGTPNYPNSGKCSRGRTIAATFVREQTGVVYSAVAFGAAYPAPSPPSPLPASSGEARPIHELLARLSGKRRRDLAAATDDDRRGLDRSRHFAKVTGWLKGDGFSPAECEALWREFPDGAGYQKYAASRHRDELGHWTADAWAKAGDTPPGGFDPDVLPPPMIEGAAPKTAPVRGNLTDLGEDRPYVPRPELIRDTLPRTGVAFIGGQSGALKSFCAVHLATCIGTGEDFAGRKVERAGGVVYVPFEGQGTIEGRVKARRSQLADAYARLPLMLLTGLPALSEEQAFAALEAWLREANEHFRRQFNLPLVAFIIDTVAAAGMTAEDKENDQAAWQKVFDAINPISQRLDALAMLVHHAGKQATAGLRGSSNIRAGADAVLMLSCERNEINGQSHGHRIALSKSRDAPEGPIAAIRAVTVKISERADGSDVTSLVLNFDTERKIVNAKMRKPNKAEEAFREALICALKENGETVPERGIAGAPEKRAIRVADVRAAFAQRYVTGSENDRKRQDNLRKQFSRAMKWADDTGLAVGGSWNGTEWLWHPEDNRADARQRATPGAIW